MKKLLVLLLLLPFVASAKGAKGRSRHIDITPSIDRTEPPLTVDLDFNIYGNVGEPGSISDIGSTIYTSPTIQYQYGDYTFEFQSTNIPLRGGGAQNYEYDNYFGIIHTKSFEGKFDHIKINSGSIVGFAYNYLNPGSNTSPITLHSLSFVDINYVQGDDWLVHAGPYHVNQALSTTTDYFGWQCGFVYTLFDYVRFQGDYYSGHSNVSGAQVSTTLLISKNFNFRFGVVVPTKDSGNEFAGDLGLVFKY